MMWALFITMLSSRVKNVCTMLKYLLLTLNPPKEFWPWLCTYLLRWKQWVLSEYGYYIQSGIIRKISSIEFWTKAQQPINLSPIFARHWHHISICFKPFDVNQQARCLEFFPMILRASSKALTVESYLLCLFCCAMVCRSIVSRSTVCPRPLPAKPLLSSLSVPSYHD